MCYVRICAAWTFEQSLLFDCADDDSGDVAFVRTTKFIEVGIS
jgi:hypothetical protein